MPGQRPGRRQPGGNDVSTHTATSFAMRHFALALCLLGLGAAGSACFSSELDSYSGAARGVRAVAFDRNGGDSDAVPLYKAVRSPETTLGSLPLPPTRAGHLFAGWNTGREGEGAPFTEETQLEEEVLIVYAQWKQLRLGIELGPGTPRLTPLKAGLHNERLATFTVTAVGFDNEADTHTVELESTLPPELALREVKVLGSTPKARTFSLTLEYDGMTAVPEGFAFVQLGLSNIPRGYAYSEGATLRLEIVDGQAKTRPIPVHAGNIKAFNGYADTTQGLKRHYRLTEDVHLTPPAGAEESNWSAIGSWGKLTVFSGSFDGGGHRVFNLTLHSPSNHQGMFGTIGGPAQGPGAEIKNLGLENLSVTAARRVGGLVGDIWKGSTVQDSYVKGHVRGVGQVGGLAGENGGTVRNCYATGSVKGDGWWVGGLLGANGSMTDGGGGMLHNSYAASIVNGESVVGGLVGENWRSTVHNSYATGSVNGTAWYVGGLAGCNEGGTVQSSYATGRVEGRSQVGGLVGENWLGGTVHNSVALNPSVIAREADVGRVVGRLGQDSGALSDNRARGDMSLRHNNNSSYWPPPGLDLKDGAEAAGYNTKAFWEETMRWNFSETGQWRWEAGSFPILRSVGGGR